VENKTASTLQKVFRSKTFTEITAVRADSREEQTDICRL